MLQHLIDFTRKLMVQECCETAISLGRMTLLFSQDYFSRIVTHADSVWDGASWMRPKPSGHILISILYSLIGKKHDIKQHAFNRTCYNVFKHRNFAPGWEPPDAFDKNLAEMQSHELRHDQKSTKLSASNSDGDDGTEVMSATEASCASNDTSD